MAPKRRLADLPERLSEAEFWALFGEIERETLDFKKGVSHTLKSAIPAMAMTRGGLVVHGVADDRTIVGCPLTQRTQDNVTSYANECHVPVKMQALWVGEHELTVTEVPEVRGRIVTTLDGRLLRRVGGDCMPLRGDGLARFVRRRAEIPYEEEPLRAALNPDDFDLGRVNDVLAAEKRPPVPLAGIARALVDLGVAERGSSSGDTVALTAAAVLFARDPRRFVQGAAVHLVRREGVGPGPGPISDRQECFGPLVYTLECCLGFVASHTRQYEVVVGTRPTRVPQYPDAVVREVVLNALAHRDYGLVGATTDLTVWDDRLEVRSPGPLPGHITPENMRTEHFSRNRRIMRVLKTLGFVEEYGEGVDRMFREMNNRLMPDPVFEVSDSSVTVKLFNRFLVDVEEQAWLALLGGAHTSRDERLALVTVRRAGSAARRQLADQVPEADIDRLLSSLVARGLLVRVGRGGGTRYQLSDEVLLRVGSTGIEAHRRRRRLLLDELARRGSLSTAEAAALLDGHTAPARQMLSELVEAGLAHPVGNTRARRYHLTSSHRGN